MQIFRCIPAIAAGLKKHSLSVLSSEPGSLSSGRLLMCIFAAFALVAMTAVGVHVLRLKDTAQLHEWLTALPSISSGLAVFIGLPYGLSRGGASLSDIANSLRKRD